MHKPPPFKPLTIYHTGDRVIDDRDYSDSDDENTPGGIFEALAHFRSGYLAPRYVAIDRPGEFWARIDDADIPLD